VIFYPDFGIFQTHAKFGSVGQNVALLDKFLDKLVTLVSGTKVNDERLCLLSTSSMVFYL